MAHECQHLKRVMSAQRTSLSTPSCSWRATFSGILATPRFLRYTPSRHPICESGIAVIRRRSSPHRRTPTCLLTGASLPMNPAAPFLFRDTPACLPIRESISAIVWVCWGGWHWWHHWRQGWQRLGWQRSLWQRSRWRCCGWTTAVVDSAAPGFLVSCPRIFCIHGAIERVHWTNRHRLCRWQCVRRCGWWCRRWCWRWRGRWRRERSGWNCHWGLRQGCGGTSRGAPPAHGAAAEILLGLRPCCFPHREAIITIIWKCCSYSR